MRATEKLKSRHYEVGPCATAWGQLNHAILKRKKQKDKKVDCACVFVCIPETEEERVGQIHPTLSCTSINSVGLDCV